MTGRIDHCLVEPGDRPYSVLQAVGSFELYYYPHVDSPPMHGGKIIAGNLDWNMASIFMLQIETYLGSGIGKVRLRIV